MPVSHVAFLPIHVRDIDRAIAFYTDVLGFPKTTDNRMGPMRWVELTPRGAQTRVTLLAEGNPAFEADRVGKDVAAAFEVADFEATCADLRAKGVRFQTEPTRQPWGWWAVVLDSEGNGLGLHGD